MAHSADIFTSRLCITPFTESHISKEYINWLNDKNLMRYSEQRHNRHTTESCLAYLRSFEGTPHYFWAIIAQDKGLGHIGNINAYLNIPNRLADIGIVIGKHSAQRQGYGLEAWEAVCTFLMQSVSIRKITAGTMANNTPMIQLMQAAGMAEDGVRKRHYLCDGIEADVLHMAFFADSQKTNEINLSDQ